MRLLKLCLALMVLKDPACAASRWTWSYSGAGITASGTFTTVDKPDRHGAYAITGIQGTRNGERITGLQKTGTAIPGNAGYPVDNLVFASGPGLSGHGFGYTTASGNHANPFCSDSSKGSTCWEFHSAGASGTNTSEKAVAFSVAKVSAVPKPRSFKSAFTFSRYR